jgi:hypothetical protein
MMQTSPALRALFALLIVAHGFADDPVLPSLPLGLR